MDWLLARDDFETTVCLSCDHLVTPQTDALKIKTWHKVETSELCYRTVP